MFRFETRIIAVDAEVDVPSCIELVAKLVEELLDTDVPVRGERGDHYDVGDPVGSNPLRKSLFENLVRLTEMPELVVVGSPCPRELDLVLGHRPGFVREHEIEEADIDARELLLEPSAQAEQLLWLVPPKPVVAAFLHRRVDQQHTALSAKGRLEEGRRIGK